MKKVMCFGTFDIVHEGHRFYLSEAKKLGGFLVVAVALDRTVEEVKKSKPLHDENERMRQVSQLGIADKVVLGYHDDKFRIIEEEKPDVVCLGYDQKFFVEGLKERMKERGLNVEVVRLPAHKPDVYKSSLLRGKHNFNKQHS